jgi:hypothetical protein
MYHLLSLSPPKSKSNKPKNAKSYGSSEHLWKHIDLSSSKMRLCPCNASQCVVKCDVSSSDKPYEFMEALEMLALQCYESEHDGGGSRCR